MHVIFNHGKESGPWGTKIKALAAAARELDCTVGSIDYQGQMDVDKRVETLLEAVTDSSDDDIFLVGSSMGGYVATAVAGQVECKGLFVLAPAYYLGGNVDFDSVTVNCETHIVHGWHDDIVPVENSWRFANRTKANLYLVNDDHRLIETLDDSVKWFKQVLSQAQRKARG
ncbi:alpha/beta fold hydrolase [Idiomarina seosinensis]|uniref:Alpha/beta hydrolase n=1 Tax=Idiomarina seosinensis TaxID=281739 RepID=A0A432ZHK9_9GAMM|nr:alpha/beta hydrolase [Idiomarina seosinensis]RUO77448.1 alpha/beta hydrolase [Idiomarina seosinensis]